MGLTGVDYDLLLRMVVILVAVLIVLVLANFRMNHIKWLSILTISSLRLSF